MLTAKAPTVTLSRVQSGVGALHVEALCPPSVGDLRLGVAYELTDGQTSVARHSGGPRFGPPDSRQPVLMTSRGANEEVDLDLRQCGALKRALIFGFSEAGRPLNWSGALQVVTFACDRIEVGLDSVAGAGRLALLSIYNVNSGRGSELVVRAELELIDASVRDLCKAYGYDRISWLDENTPLG